jgi:hypothetical protein
MRKELGPHLFFENQLAGIFPEGTILQTNGQYSYMPIRGPGHLALWRTLDAHSSALCQSEMNGNRVLLKVAQGSNRGQFKVLEVVPHEQSDL